MQRKNYLLKRRGIAMIMAIAVIIILSTIMALTLSLTAETTKRTTDIYLYEQAQLLAKGAAEYAILAVSGYDRTASGDCLTSINAVYPDNGSTTKIFDINVSLQYIGLDCDGAAGGDADFLDSVDTPQSEGTVIMDVVVTCNDATSNACSEPIRYHRRTLQKL
jgi:hypothetical protein